MRYVIVVIGVLLAALPVAARPDSGQGDLIDAGGRSSLTTVQSNGIVVNVQLQTHVALGMPEQDVFIGRGGIGADLVMRIDPTDIKGAAILNQMLYASTRANPHDARKLGPNPLGPFAKGVALGVTLQQWLRARGSGTYTVKGDTAVIDLTFRRLIPNGLYTMWCVPNPGRPPGPLPCGSVDGSENAFRADAAGNGALRVRTRGLPAGGVIAAAYHSDGNTYGRSPGEFGRNSHVQVLFFLPDWVQAGR